MPYLIDFTSRVDLIYSSSLGITFVLLAIRTNASRSDYTTRNDRSVRNTLTPRWPHNNNESELDSEVHQDCGSLRAGNSNGIGEEKFDTQGENGGAPDGDRNVDSSDSEEPPKVSLSIE